MQMNSHLSEVADRMRNLLILPDRLLTGHLNCSSSGGPSSRTRSIGHYHAKLKIIGIVVASRTIYDAYG